MRRYGDRLDTVSIGPWWLRLTYCRAGGAYSLYLFRRRLLFRPIEYGK